MLSINFEGWAPITSQYSEPGKTLKHFTVRANTPQEIHEQATLKAKELGIEEYSSVALHNNRADWVAVYGEPDGQCSFGDSFN
jgi:hypothetical protein